MMSWCFLGDSLTQGQEPDGRPCILLDAAYHPPLFHRLDPPPMFSAGGYAGLIAARMRVHLLSGSAAEILALANATIRTQDRESPGNITAVRTA